MTDEDARRSRTILHVDMDAFFAAVEQRDRPELRGKPVIVGADPKGGRGRGVVSTASYEARRFGVGSAMPISEAWRRCPQGVYVHPDMGKYARESERIMEIFHRFTDLVEPVSIDEAFLDVTGSARAMGPGDEIGRKLKRAIRDETRLTASVGVASSKLVAKVASDLGKPDGLVVVPGVGGGVPRAAPRAAALGRGTEDGRAAREARGRHDRGSRRPRSRAPRAPPRNARPRPAALARGDDEREVAAESAEAKSLGQEHTYDRTPQTPGGCGRRSSRSPTESRGGCARTACAARTVTLKYRDEDFHTTTHARTLEEATDSGNGLFRVASELFAEVHRGQEVRLLGIYASHFGEAKPQLGLFEEPKAPSPMDRVRDAVRKRFGEEAITRASLSAAASVATPPTSPALIATDVYGR